MKIVICDDREFELEILRTMCEEYAAENEAIEEVADAVEEAAEDNAE